MEPDGSSITISNGIISSSGGGGGSGIAIGTTAITGGTNLRVLYDNSGVAGEYSVTGTGTTVPLSTSPTFTTGLTSPLVIGGTTASSTLTLESTSGAGTTDAIIFNTASQSEKMRLQTGGALGIGTTTNGTNAKLAVNGGASFGTYGSTAAAGISNGLIVSGNLGIGSSVPTKNLTVQASSAGNGVNVDGLSSNAPSIALSNSGLVESSFGLAFASSQYSNVALAGDTVFQAVNSSSSRLIFSNQESGSIAFATGTSSGNDTFKMVVLTGGGIGIGTVTMRNSANLDVQGNLNVNGTTINAPNLGTSSAATTGTVCWTTGTGLFNVDTTVACLASLEELKDIQKPITGGLAIVSKINPFWFKWKTTTPEFVGDKYEQAGMGAHQVESVDKRLVAYSPNGKLKGVRYQQMTAVLVEAVKELKASNDRQQREIDVLKRRLGEQR